MSVADEIQDLNTNLTAAKNAVESMGGTVGDTGLAGLADEIETIPTGGGDTSDDVRFIDYDGTIVAQMSIAEAQALTELPAGPTHTGLTFDGWTHTLQEVKSAGHILDVGAMYSVSDDPNTTLIKWTPLATDSITIEITQDISEAVEVDWGDATTPETTTTTGSAYTFSHTYTNASGVDPVFVKIKLLEPTANVSISSMAFNSSSFGVWADLIVVGKVTLTVGPSVKNIIFSKMTTTIPSFSSNKVLEHIVIPNTVTAIGTSNFNGCARLAEIVLPNSIQTVSGSNHFDSCWNLRRLVQPEGLSYLFSANSLYSLKQFEPSNCTASSMGQFWFRYTGIKEFVVPTTITQIGNRAFSQSRIERIKFGNISTMPSIDNAAFSWLQEVDFTECTQVPTASSVNWIINNLFEVRIYVPSNLVNAWKADSVWSTVASQIIGV